MAFTVEEIQACQRLVELALQEDLGVHGDITSQAAVPETMTGRAVLVARSEGILAGLPIGPLVFRAIDPGLRFEAFFEDGSPLNKGDRIAAVSGPMRGILAGERTALNFLQYLSGIATQTRRCVDAVRGLPCKILDTRKTLPGWRLLAKYAVRQGGGHNHRLGLFDGILLKDNHWQALARVDERFITHNVLATMRERFPTAFIEIEVDDLEQFDIVLPLQPDAILLDNMGAADLREAVRRRNTIAPPVLLEASGGVTLETIRSLAETGVDRISVGALTHSVAALDIALDYEEMP